MHQNRVSEIASGFAPQGITRNSAVGISFCPFNRRENRPSLVIFDRREIAHHGGYQKAENGEFGSVVVGFRVFGAPRFPSPEVPKPFKISIVWPLWTEHRGTPETRIQPRRIQPPILGLLLGAPRAKPQKLTEMKFWDFRHKSRDKTWSDNWEEFGEKFWWVVLHSTWSTKMPRKFRPKFRPIFAPTLRPEFRPVIKICRRNFALGNVRHNLWA